MKVLNVAEKNDAAKNIAEILGNGRINRREGFSKFNKIYEFEFLMNGLTCKMVMTSVSGHLMNYEFEPNFKSWQSTNPALLFDAPILKSVIKDVESIQRTLQREIRGCQKLIIWTDCDREGENIGVEIINVCKAIHPTIDVSRAKFSEITPLAIRNAINQLAVPDYRVSDAVDARQELDLRIGAAFTRFQTLRLQRAFPRALANQLISYGSCQFPTLGFVVERFREVDRFVPEPFWRINVTAEQDGKSVDFQWKRGRVFDEDCCRAYYVHLQENRYGQIVEVVKRPKSRWRPVALDTVEMEKLATRKLRLGAKKAMQLAERLYTRGFISYPRTETNIFPASMDLTSLVRTQLGDSRWSDFASRVLTRGVSPRNGKNTDKAHPPIHPLKVGGELQGDEARLFELITRHFLACLSADARGAETSVRLCFGRPAPPSLPMPDSSPLLNEEDGELFEAKGLVIMESNYLDVYPYEKWTERDMPNFVQGEWILPINIEMASGRTTPPPLLTEADLITLMDRHGIGTDATHAEHIETIKQRLYVGLEQSRFLVPGQLGMGLVEGYDAMDLTMSKPQMRAELETDLKKICNGHASKEDVLRRHIAKYKELFEHAVARAGLLDRSLANRLEQSAEIPQSPPNTEPFRANDPSSLSAFSNSIASCPSCSRAIALRQRRPPQRPLSEISNNSDTQLNTTSSTAWFLSCSGYPICRYAIWFPDSVTHVRVALDQHGNPEYCTRCSTHAPPNTSIPNTSTVTGPIKLAIRFRPNQRLPNGYRQDDETTDYVTCVFCDDDLRTALGIRISHSSTQTNSSNTDRPTHHVNNVPNPRPPDPPCVPQPGSQATWDTPVDEPVTVCNCGNPAVTLTVRKPGPNQGRLFYRCAGRQGTSCDFFQWKSPDHVPAPLVSSTQIPPGPSPSNSMSLTRAGSTSNNDAVLCRCGDRAKLLRVTKATANQGRGFYACPNGRSSGTSGRNAGCGFFMWADDVNGTDQIPHQPERPNRMARSNSSSDTGSISLGHVPVWPPPASSGLRSSSTRRPKSRGTTVRKCGLCGEPGHTRARCSRNNQ